MLIAKNFHLCVLNCEYLIEEVNDAAVGFTTFRYQAP
jgi:hypothetical protein